MGGPVGPAKYFYCLWYLILDKNSNNNLKERYEQFKPDEFSLNEFENRFYKLRSDMIQNNLKYWKSLNPFFKITKDIIIKLCNYDNIFIITTKDKKSVKLLLELNHCFISEKNIYTKEDGLDKNKILLDIIAENKIKEKDILFFEDNIMNLIKAKNIGVNCFLATWGYIAKDAKNIAQLNSITSIDENELNKMIYA